MNSLDINSELTIFKSTVMPHMFNTGIVAIVDNSLNHMRHGRKALRKTIETSAFSHLRTTQYFSMGGNRRFASHHCDDNDRCGHAGLEL